MALPKRTQNEIKQIVQEFCAKCAEAGLVDEDGNVDLKRVFEHLPRLYPGWSFEPVEREDLRADYVALTLADKRIIQMVCHAYEGLCRGEEEHMFTGAHEIAHMLMHSNVELARSEPMWNSVSISEEIENEADEFARLLLGYDSPANEHANCEALRLIAKVMKTSINISWGRKKEKGSRNG